MMENMVKLQILKINEFIEHEKNKQNKQIKINKLK